MKRQGFEQKSDEIRTAFLTMKKKNPEKLVRTLTLSWSNWGFGMEDLAVSAARLAENRVGFIELHGNHYGPDLGYQPKETMRILSDYGIQVAGICGMFSSDNDMASNRAVQRQCAIDYIKREINFAAEVGALYLLVVPAAVGRPVAYDDMEFSRSVETIRLVADLFIQHDVKAAIEPIRSAETTIVHTVAEAKKYIATVSHPGVRHINGDIYHMQSEESHIGEAILEAGAMLVNLHMADSNRCALGLGSMDLDTIIRALYLSGYNTEGHCITPEPLGPGGDPYPAMNGKPEPEYLNQLVRQTVYYFRERESEVRGDV